MNSSTSPTIQLYASNGPLLQWSATGLPPGLTLNASTGVLSGTVQDPGLYPVMLTIRNALGEARFSQTVEVPSVLRLGSYPGSVIPSGSLRIAAVTVSNYPLLLDESGRVTTLFSSGMPRILRDIAALGSYGSYHSLALQEGGQVIAWASNNSGESTVPGGLTNTVAVAAGWTHSLALRTNGTVVAWGSSTSGQATVPPALGDVVAIAAGGSHSLALRSEGTVTAWGSNSYGESAVPAGLVNVTAIAAGEHHSMALKRDGTVSVWGDNDYGQRIVPAGLNGVVAISAGYDHCAALKSDGRVVVWGYNYYDQATVPASLTAISAISAGGWETMLITGRPANVRPVIVSPRRALTSAAGTAGPGLQFSYRIAATGLPASYSTSGLPAGLTLNASTGVISGTAAEAGEYDITVRAVNAAGTGTTLLGLNVLGVPQLLEPEVQINAATPVQRQINASALPVSWVATGLPEGLTLNTSTGVLSGLTATTGIYRIPLTIANARYPGTSELRLLVLPAREAAQAAYAVWRDTYWAPAATSKDPASDADADGRSNLLEFALGTDPLVADRGEYVQFFYNSEGRLELQVSVAQTAAAALLTRAQFAGATHFGADRVDTMSTGPGDPEPPGKIRLRFVQPEQTSGTARQFARIVFSLPP